MELEDLAEGLLTEVKMYASLDACIKNTNLLLLLDDNNKMAGETRIQVLSIYLLGPKFGRFKIYVFNNF